MNVNLKPIEIVYTGNISYGRWKTLARVAEFLAVINSDYTKAILNIYSQNTINTEIDRAININNASYFRGSVSYNEVKKILNKADIVLHVESFENKYANATRLSFSTKIIDCMESGSCIMAIGPENLASISYLINNNCALVATDAHQINQLILTVIENPKVITQKAAALNEFAKKNHDIKTIQNMLDNDFKRLLN
ncbi:hypothetical protein QRD90_18170 [Peribacillus frigoritolerans]|uniref:glycosyltransferase family protein n=1 Tax=Peribacillus frigoritolerans TaxID=450367 RepID=UPI0025710DDE|nr:hypothetical protein [Peribacillus frigoritolerans]WJE46141.1 hypothetical protein QRD90_18170 [Peribacillus frigoritolerans]